MSLNMARLEPGSCTSGTGVFYVCQANGFKGCCLVDPCVLAAGCPNLETTSLVSSGVATTILSTSIARPSSSTPASRQATVTVSVFTERSTQTSSSVQTFTSSAASSLTKPPTITTNTATTSFTSQTAAQSATQPDTPSKARLRNAPLIAGLIVGIIVLAFLVLLGWICLRRHRKLKESRSTRASYGLASPSNDFVLDRAVNTETEALHQPSGDVFAQFGGRHTPVQNEPAELAHHTEMRERVEIGDTRPLPGVLKIGVNNNPAIRNVQVAHVQSNNSEHASYGFATPSTGLTDNIVSPLIPSPHITSPVPGVMELEADVPSSFVSPMVDSGRSQYSNVNSKTLSTSTTTTQVSAVGLGVDAYHVNDDSSPVPSLSRPAFSSTFVPASNSGWRNSSTPPLPVRSNLRPSNSTSTTNQDQTAIQNSEVSPTSGLVPNFITATVSSANSSPQTSPDSNPDKAYTTKKSVSAYTDGPANWDFWAAQPAQ